MTATQDKFEIGDEVTFSGGSRGKHKGMQTGIIVGFHYKEFRGRRRILNEMYGGEAGVEVLKIQVGETIWKVGRSLVKIIRKNAVEKKDAVTAGAERSAEIRKHNLEMRYKQQSENFDTADNSGLYALRVGDQIEVQLHDRNGTHRWYPAFFNGIVRSSGRIKIRQSGTFQDRLFTTPPKYVRIPGEPK